MLFPRSVLCCTYAPIDSCSEFFAWRAHTHTLAPLFRWCRETQNHAAMNDPIRISESQYITINQYSWLNVAMGEFMVTWSANYRGARFDFSDAGISFITRWHIVYNTGDQFQKLRRRRLIRSLRRWCLHKLIEIRLIKPPHELWKVSNTLQDYDMTYLFPCQLGLQSQCRYRPE